jgi:hypothetical protein
MIALMIGSAVLLAFGSLAAWFNRVPNKVRALEMAPEFGL